MISGFSPLFIHYELYSYLKVSIDVMLDKII